MSKYRLHHYNIPLHNTAGVDNTVKPYTELQIRPCTKGTYGDMQVVSGKVDLDEDIVWSLYGRTLDGDVDCIGDFNCESGAVVVASKIVGHIVEGFDS